MKLVIVGTISSDTRLAWGQTCANTSKSCTLIASHAICVLRICASPAFLSWSCCICTSQPASQQRVMCMYCDSKHEELSSFTAISNASNAFIPALCTCIPHWYRR